MSTLHPWTQAARLAISRRKPEAPQFHVWKIISGDKVLPNCKIIHFLLSHFLSPSFSLSPSLALSLTSSSSSIIAYHLPYLKHIPFELHFLSFSPAFLLVSLSLSLSLSLSSFLVFFLHLPFHLLPTLHSFVY